MVEAWVHTSHVSDIFYAENGSSAWGNWNERLLHEDKRFKYV